MLIEAGLGKLADVYLKMFKDLEDNGVPLIDHIIIDTLGKEPDKGEYYRKRIEEIKPGLTHFLFHPAKMSSELSAITQDSAEWRNQDYEAFTDSRMKKYVEDYNLKVIGYREIRDYIRNY